MTYIFFTMLIFLVKLKFKKSLHKITLAHLKKKLKMHTVTYFGIPGRGEIVRLMLQIGGLPFDDVIISGKQWRDLKPKTR